ncbi:MAG: phosphatidylserine decarboxylase [Methylobacteriaceae bacterium]|nr:phosphatidylserine decarboxylase [Methylobacteriaceae bacterium]
MAIIQSLRRQIVPVHPEGYIFIVGFAVVALFLDWLWTPLGWIGAIATLWCVYFFRDPSRVTPVREGLVIAPADGIVSSVGFYVPPPELGLGDRPMQRVSVFMSIFDCHVNRAPVTGRIVRIAYKPGLFLNADLDKASEDNERNGLVIESAQARFGVVQIAGLVARRIVTFVREGQTIGMGDRFGLIRFGSRLDVYFPAGASLLAGLGQRAVAGETVLADLASASRPPAFRMG